MASSHFRAFERRKIPLTARLWLEKEGPESFQATVTDVSLAGIGLQLRQEQVIEPSTSVVIELSAPNLWDALMLRGTVVWSRTLPHGPCLGVSFDHDAAAPLYGLFETIHLFAFDEGERDMPHG